MTWKDFEPAEEVEEGSIVPKCKFLPNLQLKTGSISAVRYNVAIWLKTKPMVSTKIS